jgi:hypothetical protein
MGATLDPQPATPPGLMAGGDPIPDLFRTGDPAITILAQLLHVLPLRIQDSIERPDLGGRRSKIRGPTPFEIPFGLTASSSCSNRSMC